jgi:hypothetical protein
MAPCASVVPPSARTALATNSNGFLILARYASSLMNSGDSKMVRSIDVMSPPVFR